MIKFYSKEFRVAIYDWIDDHGVPIQDLDKGSEILLNPSQELFEVIALTLPEDQALEVAQLYEWVGPFLMGRRVTGPAPALSEVSFPRFRRETVKRQLLLFVVPFSFRTGQDYSSPETNVVAFCYTMPRYS